MNQNIFSYTKRDYEGSRREGLSQIPILSGGVWTDLNATDPGIIILDYAHALADMIQYYQDHQALETFISTAKERANIFRLAKQLSYQIRSAKGATCEVVFSSVLLYNYTIRIPKHTRVSTIDGIIYLTTEDAYLLPGSNTVTVKCTQGQLLERTYQGTGISRFSNVVNPTNQSVHIMVQNIDVDSIVITDNVGRVWKPVEYIVFATEIDRAYQVDLNPDDTVTILFGDGERGIVPKSTDTLTISYIVTDADQGRVSANSLIVLQDQILDDQGRYIDLHVTNPLASAGGSTTQTSQEIKSLAPGAIKAQDRAVTLNDFENLAKMVDGVADAKAYDINTKPDLCLHHEVKVLITPQSIQDSPELLKEKVYSHLSSRMIPPTNLQILTPAFEYVDIELTVKKLDIITEGRLTYDIQQAIETYFSNRAGAIGEYFYPSDLLALISNINGVRYITSMTPNTTISTSDLSVLRLGNVNITVE